MTMWRCSCSSPEAFPAVALLGALLWMGTPMADAQQAAEPALHRIKMATVNVPDMEQWSALYKEWLDYQVVEQGEVPAALAASWGAPASAGQRYAVMAPASGTDVFIRAVEGDRVPGYRAMTTWGWNAIEIIIDDIDVLYAKLKDSPFEFVGLPASLGARYPTIHAMQVKGPAEEVLYLTTETGDRSTSPLPLPGGLVDRPFIMVVAGPDIEAMRDWWTSSFNLPPLAINESLGKLTRTAQNAAAEPSSRSRWSTCSSTATFCSWTAIPPRPPRVPMRRANCHQASP